MRKMRCPHCHAPFEVGSGYHHDESLNIRCDACDNVVFATNAEDEKSVASLYQRPSFSYSTNPRGHHPTNYYGYGD